MKRQVFIVVAVCLMVLPACASNGRTQYASDARIVVDQQYVNEVNNVSRNTGVSVTWINPPTKRIPLIDNSDD